MRTGMTLAGNTCLALALVVYITALPFVLNDRSGRASADGIIISAVLVLIPMWLLIATALCIGTARGGFDWIAVGRGAQLIVVVVSCAALLAVSAMSVVGKVWPPSDVPWAARPFAKWGVYVLPLVAIVFGLCAINLSPDSSFPAAIYRLPFALVAGAAVLAGIGLLGQWVADLQHREAERVQEEARVESERDQQTLARIRSLDPDRDVPELLGHTNRYNTASVRDLALERLARSSNLTQAVAGALSGGWAEQGLIYVDACDVADPEALAEPVRQAILRTAERVRDLVRREHALQPDSFDFKTRLVVSAVTKFHGRGVDYAPAVRKLRAALNEPRSQTVHFTAADTLDRWLADADKPPQP